MTNRGQPRRAVQVRRTACHEFRVFLEGAPSELAFTRTEAEELFDQLAQQLENVRIQA